MGYACRQVGRNSRERCARSYKEIVNREGNRWEARDYDEDMPLIDISADELVNVVGSLRFGQPLTKPFRQRVAGGR
jgi:hypothetical protein